MSDDLVWRLREVSFEKHHEAWGRLDGGQDLTIGAMLAEQAADRIEELEAENKLLRDAVYIDDLTVTMQASDRSKAIATIGRALDLLGADMLGEAKTTLRTTLAELTGESHE